MKNSIGLVMVMLLLLLACNARKKSPEPTPPPIKEKDSIVTNRSVLVTVRDTVFITEPDSVYYNAYVDCVNNKPVLRDPEQKSTKGVKTDVKLQDGKLTVNVQTEAQKLFVQWKEKYIRENTLEKKTISVPYPVIEKVPVPAEFTKFQKIYIKIGQVVSWGLLGALLIFIIIKIPWKTLFRL